MRHYRKSESNPPAKAADYLKKLRLLEARLGATTQYAILEPVSCNPRNPIDLQNTAKHIASFVGLDECVFIVVISKQKDGTGGHIELNNNENDVFIEISRQVSESPNSTLAVLSHEISHKLLHLNGISLGQGLLEKYENEILTDIAAVFVGLGKLMLNGSESHTESTSGTMRTIHTVRTGYLDTSQMAFVYRLVCAMRGIRERDMVSGLTPRARAAVRAWARFDPQYFDPEFRDREYRQSLAQDMKERAKHLQEGLVDMKDRLAQVRRDLIDASESFLAKTEQTMTGMEQRAKVIESREIHDPADRFLDTISLVASVRHETERTKKILAATHKWSKRLDRAASGGRPRRKDGTD